MPAYRGRIIPFPKRVTMRSSFVVEMVGQMRMLKVVKVGSSRQFTTFVKDQQIRYTLGGRGGWQSDEINSQNRDPGAAKSLSRRDRWWWNALCSSGFRRGGSSAVDFEIKFPLLVAGGGGGGTGNKGTVALGGVGASNVDGAYGPSNYPNVTGKASSNNLSYRSGAGTKDGQNQDLTNWT